LDKAGSSEALAGKKAFAGYGRGFRVELGVDFVGGMVARAGMLSWLLAVGGIGGMVAGAVAGANYLQLMFQ
jgi:hypothetical protein